MQSMIIRTVNVVDPFSLFQDYAMLSMFTCRIWHRDSKKSTSSDLKFGELIVQLDLSSSWTFGVKWSPSGNTLAYVGHNSMIYFVDDVGPSPLAQNVVFRDLPLRDVGIICF
jgi:actin related protein 2/3 complex subunit 1A/1B